MPGLGGLNFEVGPVEALSQSEIGYLSGLPSGVRSSGRTFVIHVGDDLAFHDSHNRPEHEWSDGILHVAHRSFSATLDPESWRASLRRRADADAVCLQIILKTALAAQLPAIGAVPLHGAAVVMDEHAVCFFGRSGAGKTTLAKTSTDRILSDELVVLEAKNREALASGFWGDLHVAPVLNGRYPIRALISLEKAAQFEIAPLERRELERCLLPCIMVPPIPSRWQQVLDLLEPLLTIPAFRMGWSPASPPWSELRQFLHHDA